MQRFAARLAAIALFLPLGAMAAAFQDVLDTPASQSRFAVRSLLNGLTLAGKRLVAVGQRGHVVYSDDAGASWLQAKVPVSSDLVAVSFPSPQQGWAVGHDGVVLHSADGGANWVRQLDGRSLGRVLLAHYESLAARGLLGSAEESAALLGEVRRMAGQGAENSLLDVWFADEKNGFVVGAFNLILRTADGGETWEPWLHRTANPTRLHLYSISQVNGELYVSGEQGLLMKLEPRGERFVGLDAGYRGTYFGTTGRDGAVLAFGLRGNAFRSTDGGKSWRKVETGLQDGITGAAVCDHRLLLVSQSGKLLVSEDGGVKLSLARIEQPAPASAVACVGGDRVAIAGPRGISVQSFK